jgi:hypothetical protein
LEEKFCEWSRRNVERLEKAGKKLGEIKIVQGDARRLSEILGRADVAITSPPYTNSAAENPNVVELQKKGWVKGGDLSKFFPKNLSPYNIGNFPFGNVDVAITSPPYAETYTGGGDPQKRKERLIKAGRNPKEFLGGKARNAVLKHYGEVDVCLTSPPYSETYSSSKAGKAIRTGQTKIHDEKHLARTYTEDLGKDNIGNLPHGNVDAIVTSPPYGEAVKAGNPPSEKEFKRALEKGFSCSDRQAGWMRNLRKALKEPNKSAWKGFVEGYSKSQQNIGNLPFVDTVITSPPYEQGLGHNPGKKKITELGIVRPEYNWQNPNQIGSMQKETYLSAMLQVYSEMFSVLKPNGLAIIIVKPFIRNKRVVDLPWHTWLIMAKVGFTLEKLYKLRLKQQSFWRILQYKNNPDLERICHEYVIVAKKPTAT